jgi:beta-N-acetylhexosaminidase
MVAGVILFSRNYNDKVQLRALNQHIKSINPDLLISVDHEGGRVQRFKKDFTLIPDMRAIGALYDVNKELAIKKAYSIGLIIGIELTSVGIDFSFTPVCDLDYQNNAAIGNRAFHKNPEASSLLNCALYDGLHEAGCIGVAKHFPGHGFVKADSHAETPIDPRPFVDIENNDIIPFNALIKKGIEAIMPAHIIYPDFDPNFTALSSIKWMEYLKNDLGFNGIIISDDLDMQGACSIGDAKMRALACFNSGIDLLLCCNSIETITAILDSFKMDQHPNTALREKIAQLKAQKIYPFEYEEVAIWQKATDILFN